MRAMLAVPAAALALAALPILAIERSGQSTGPVVFDAYVAGIKVAELTILRDQGAARYSIRKRDLPANRWGSPRSAAESEVASDTSFLLQGSIRQLPAQLHDIEQIGWSSLKAVGWPDASTIYVPHRTSTETVGDRPVTAVRWAQRDGTRPMDLVIGRDNRLIAGIDPAADIVLVRRGHERFTTVARWNDPSVSAGRYGYRMAERALVPASDEVRLTTLVYLPDGDVQGPFPTVLIRTPYGITNLIGQFWHYAARGYALVFQAARGTSSRDPENRSEGVWDPMVNEPADGAAALEWIAAQPWSNGKVCMQGGSYVGYTQWTASMARNPALKCLVPESSMGTAFSDQPYMGGTFVEGMAYYMFFMLDRAILPDRSWTDILHHRPLIDIDRFATGQEIPQWNTMLEHATNDTYWRGQDWYRDTGPRPFSALQISGWWDDDFPGTESNWALMQRLGTGPQRLVIGPWKHGYNVDRQLNGYRFGADAVRDDIWLLKQRWYDRLLKDIDNGVERPVVEYFVLGSNEWRTAAAWPPPEATPVPWYLHSDGEASRLMTAGSLSTTRPSADEPADRYRYDPRQPPPNWFSFDQMQRWEDVQTFPYDFKDIEARPDVVVFTSAPLRSDLTIAGTLKAVLYASTDVRDTDWWVHLSDVDPDGRSNRITLGVLRARFRNLEDPQHHIVGSNFEQERLLSGDSTEVVRYEIWIRSIANTFKAGHRIRLAVMNALDNYSFPNSNTGEHEARTTATVVGTMTVHHTAAHPSHVVLPVLPK